MAWAFPTPQIHADEEKTRMLQSLVASSCSFVGVRLDEEVARLAAVAGGEQPPGRGVLMVVPEGTQ